MSSLTISANSFVQSNYSFPESCCESIEQCLPVFQESDVAFQFLHVPGPPTSYQAVLLKNGSEVGTSKELFYVNRSDGMNLVFLPDLTAMGWSSNIDIKDCFSIRVYKTEVSIGASILFQTVCFSRIDSQCWTTVIKYRCDEDAFGFDYSHDYTSGSDRLTMYNIIRLPFYVKEPQFPIKRNVFVKSNGSRKKLSSRIECAYEAATDYMRKDWHEKLIVAMEHDTVIITNTNSGLSGQPVSHESNYDIEWQKFLDYPTAPAKFKLYKTDYNKVNSNCN